MLISYFLHRPNIILNILDPCQAIGFPVWRLTTLKTGGLAIRFCHTTSTSTVAPVTTDCNCWYEIGVLSLSEKTGANWKPIFIK